MRIPYSALPGLGEKAAENLEKYAVEGEILSIEDLQVAAGLSKTHVEILRRNGVFEGLDDTTQISFF